MANIGFSFLGNGLVYLFNPASDKLVFDNTEISASEVRVFESNGLAVFNTVFDNKLAGLTLDQDTPVGMANLGSTTVIFSDGSLLKIGDNTRGTTRDNNANNLAGAGKDDHLIGLGGNDTLDGNSGNDFLEGGSGNDRLLGGAGGDVFVDSQGSNVFLGGGGDDFFFAQGHSSTVDGGSNTATGGSGRDTYYVANSGTFFPVVNYTVRDFSVGPAGDSINVSTALAQMASSDFYAGEDPLAGFIRVIQSGDDALVQADFTGTDTFTDFTTVLKLEDTSAEAAADCITGYRLGGAGNNLLTGNRSNEMLFAAAGNDTLNGGAGNDNMFGGAGDDTYIVDNGRDVTRELSNAPEGGNTDTVLAGVNYTLADFVEQLKLTGGVAKEATGNALDNSITGNGLANVLKGLAGNDTLSGSVGNDTLQGGDGNDTMVWGRGDLADGGAGTDSLKIVSGQLNLTTLPNREIVGIEQIDMTGGGKSLLTLNRADLLALSTESNTLTVLGSSGDRVDIVGSFTPGALSGVFKTYNLGGGATLLVENDVSVI
jgi:Ca2+-binding RTX toxin-like protein